ERGGDVAGERGVDDAALPVATLEPRIGEVDEDALDAPRREELRVVEVRVAENDLDRRFHPVRARGDLDSEVFADLQPDVAAPGIGRRALEEKLRVGAAELDLDLAARRERQSLGGAREVRHLERIHVLAVAGHGLAGGERLEAELADVLR